jgi:chaperonin GroES
MSKFDITKHTMLHDNVLIRAIRADEIENKSGLIDPEQYEDKPEWGEVLAVGDGRMLENGTRSPISVKPGDIVLYGKYSPYQTRVDGEDYLIVRDEEILSKA